MTERRAVITGIGAITPAGTGVVRRFAPHGCRNTRAAEIPDFDARPFFRTPKSIKLTDERTRYAVAAAAMALQDSGAGNPPDSNVAAPPERCGVLVGTSGSDLQVEDLGRALGGSDAEDVARFGERILAGLNPLWLLVNLPNMVSAHVSIQFDLRGPNSTVMTDWIAGLQAIGEAASWIENGEADLVIAGGADTGVLPFVYANYEHGAMFEDEAFVPADGAAMFVLEERRHALRRGARIYGAIAGHSSGSAPGDAMAAALDRAGWRASDVDAVSPAAVPHRLYASLESDAIGDVFGSRRPALLQPERDVVGFSLAAASPIDLALLLRSGRNAKTLANSIGFLQQGASLCVEAVA